jgi:predicted AlkP superfamily pyrophosphatase or phosphodiesterase
MITLFRSCAIAILAGAMLMPAASAAEKPIVILIGLDGLRWDYLRKYRPPNLSRLAAGGVQAKRMISSFPSLTFPNFYTLATGLYPEHHGIVSNTMFDPRFNEHFTPLNGATSKGKWWGGEPIWSTAEKQGVRAACMFWPGSEAEVAGARPSDWLPYRQDFPIEARVKTVLGWLARPAGERPRLVTLYCHEVDTAGHRFGPNSPECAAAVAKVDSAVGSVVEGVHRLGLDAVANFVVVSDHGMTEVSPDRVVAISSLVAPNAVEVDFSGAVAGLRPRHESADQLYEALVAAKPGHIHVYRRENMPERFHFRDNARIPPVILVADEGWMILKQPLLDEQAQNFLHGAHGFDPALRSMGATFIASGPEFRKGITIPPFRNIEIYDLLCATLGLKPAPNDGDGSLAEEVLR